MKVWPGSPAAKLWVWPLGVRPEPRPPSAWLSSTCPAAHSWRFSWATPSSGCRHCPCCCRGTCAAAGGILGGRWWAAVSMHRWVVEEGDCVTCQRWLSSVTASCISLKERSVSSSLSFICLTSSCRAATLFSSGRQLLFYMQDKRVSLQHFLM